jgi:hypothetical protein
VQLTPPGSPSSIQLAKTPFLYLVVNDIEAARADLIERGVDVSEVFHRGPDGRVKVRIRSGPVTARLPRSMIPTGMSG